MNNERKATTTADDGRIAVTVSVRGISVHRPELERTVKQLAELALRRARKTTPGSSS